MKLFLNDAESPFARCFIEVAHNRGNSLLAARQQVANDKKDFSLTETDSPQILTWNLGTIFSIRAVLRQCNFIWRHEKSVTYLLLLQSSMVSASLLRDKLHEIRQKIEEQLFGQLVLLRELLEIRRGKFNENKQNNQRLAFIVLEENDSLELLSSSIYSALYCSFNNILKNNNDPNIWGFYSQNGNYESFSEFILQQLEKPSNRHIGKWLNFKESWFPSRINFMNRGK